VGEIWKKMQKMGGGKRGAAGAKNGGESAATGSYVSSEYGENDEWASRLKAYMK